MDSSAISAETPAALSAAAEHERDLHGLRIWFVIFLLWMGLLTALAMSMFVRYDAGDASAFGIWILALMAVWLSLCNTLVPLPTAWIVLFAASGDVGLLESQTLRVIVVTLIATIATVMANLNEYHVLGYFFRARLGQRIRRSNAYLWAARWFDVSPFQTLVLVAFVPIPVDVVRWLAILRRYPRWNYALAYFLGRVPRYALLAGLSVMLRLDTLGIVLIQVGIVAVLGLRLLWAALRRRREGEAPAEP